VPVSPYSAGNAYWLCLFDGSRAGFVDLFLGTLTSLVGAGLFIVGGFAGVAAAAGVVAESRPVAAEYSAFAADAFHVSGVGLAVCFSAPVAAASEIAVSVGRAVPRVIVREEVHGCIIRRL
jgi:hypothetical protein